MAYKWVTWVITYNPYNSTFWSRTTRLWPSLRWSLRYHRYHWWLLRRRRLQNHGAFARSKKRRKETSTNLVMKLSLFEETSRFKKLQNSSDHKNHRLYVLLIPSLSLNLKPKSSIRWNSSFIPTPSILGSWWMTPTQTLASSCSEKSLKIHLYILASSSISPQNGSPFYDPISANSANFEKFPS